MDYSLDFNVLTGKTFSKVEKTSDSVIFYLNDGSNYILKHHQDCCESVWLEDVCGDLKDLENSPILIAHEATSNAKKDDNDYGKSMWTFYNLSTNKGSVTLRFCGSSNGYYSVSVSLDYDDSGKVTNYGHTVNGRMNDVEVVERVRQWVGSYPGPVNDQITDSVTQIFWAVTQDQELLDELIARRAEHIAKMNVD